MKAYKAFGPDWKCRGFAYEVGETYTYNGDVVICKSGFHACENPLDVLNHYDMTTCKIAEVEVGGTIVKHDEDSKVASSSISIKAELTLPEFIAAAIRFVWDACSKKQKDKADSAHLAASGHSAKLAASGHYAQLAASGPCAKLAASGDSAKLAASGHYAKLAASGDSAQLAASGDSAKLAASGHYAQLAASGDSAHLAASGDSAKLAASGHYAKLAASGHSAKLAASGDSAKLAASGHYAQLAASGHYAKLAASGDYAQLAASGAQSVIASSSTNARAKGAVGTWISLAEFDVKGACIGFATGCIGKGRIKADTWYKAQGGKLVEVK